MDVYHARIQIFFKLVKRGSLRRFFLILAYDGMYTYNAFRSFFPYLHHIFNISFLNIESSMIRNAGVESMRADLTSNFN